MRSYDRPGVELDFMVGARLSQLHVLLLLRMALVYCISEPDELLVKISADLLELVSEAVMLKSRLVDSGTSLIWKVSLEPDAKSAYLMTSFRLHIMG